MGEWALNIILHITHGKEWEQALAGGTYYGDTLASEGFIHCSTPQQVVRVANALYAGRKGLVLLCIDPDCVGSEIRYEAPPGTNETFPHIYGPLKIEAVVQIVGFEPGPDGRFALPEALARFS